MYGYGAPGVLPRAGGVPVSGVYYDRASSLVSPTEDGMRAGAGGVSIGRFGWVRPDGSVYNARQTSQDRIGLVVIQGGDWRRVFWDEASNSWKIREGMNLTMLSGAPGIWIELPTGGAWRDRVYANPVDGSPYAGYAAGLESTRWVIGLPCGAGGLSLLTTWNTPNA